MDRNETVTVKSAWADPSALGLFGLAMVTLVASSQKLGFTHDTSLVLPWAIFLGAIAQLIAGVIDLKKLNTFGGTAFIAYGLFWLAVGMGWMITMGIFGAKAAELADPRQTGVAMLGYLIFTLFMTIGSTRTNKVLLLIFSLINFLFIGLMLSSFGIAHEAMHQLAAVSELLISLLSFYGSAANLFKQHFGYELLPLGKPLPVFQAKR